MGASPKNINLMSFVNDIEEFNIAQFSVVITRRKKKDYKPYLYSYRVIDNQKEVVAEDEDVNMVQMQNAIEAIEEMAYNMPEHHFDLDDWDEDAD